MDLMMGQQWLQPQMPDSQTTRCWRLLMTYFCHLRCTLCMCLSNWKKERSHWNHGTLSCCCKIVDGFWRVMSLFCCEMLAHLFWVKGVANSVENVELFSWMKLAVVLVENLAFPRKCSTKESREKTWRESIHCVGFSVSGDVQDKCSSVFFFSFVSTNWINSSCCFFELRPFQIYCDCQMALLLESLSISSQATFEIRGQSFQKIFTRELVFCYLVHVLKTSWKF